MKDQGREWAALGFASRSGTRVSVSSAVRLVPTLPWGHRTIRTDALVLQGCSLPGGPGEPGGHWEHTGPRSPLVMLPGHATPGEGGRGCCPQPSYAESLRKPEREEKRVSYRTVCEKSPRSTRPNMQKEEEEEVRRFPRRRPRATSPSSGPARNFGVSGSHLRFSLENV